MLISIIKKIMKKPHLVEEIISINNHIKYFVIIYFIDINNI